MAKSLKQIYANLKVAKYNQRSSLMQFIIISLDEVKKTKNTSKYSFRDDLKCLIDVTGSKSSQFALISPILSFASIIARNGR